MSAEPDGFGLRLYHALKSNESGRRITSALQYAKIQELKSATRAQTALLFKGSGYLTIQRIKSDEPEQVADYLVEELETQQQAAFSLFGMAFPFIGHFS